MDYKASDAFYHSKVWKKVRKLRLRIDGGMCVECMAEMERGERLKPRRATMVHHVQPITERPDLALNVDNLRSLCDMHHNREHPEKGGQGKAGHKQTTRPHMRIEKV